MEMRSIEEIFAQLHRHGIRIWREGDRLRYRAPKGALLPELRAELMRRKDEIIMRVADSSPVPSIEADLIHRYDPFPLTEIQEAYWVGRSAAYDLGGVGVHGYVEIENCFDIDRLTETWNRVIERHEMLRAVVLPGGEQQILKSVPRYEISVIDMRNKPQAEVNNWLDQVVSDMSHQVFAADKWPLFEIRATRLEDDRTRLHISLDLLMADLWSLFIVFQDWADFAYKENHEPPALELSFRDYVLQQQACRKLEAYRRDQKYWFDRVASLPMGPDLPLARPTQGLIRPAFKRYASRLDANVWQELRTRARKYGLTPSGILLAAYAEVLGRWSRNPRFNLNLTLFNRMSVHPQINQIVGDFTTTVLLEIDHSERESFVVRARRIQKQLWDDLDHRSVNAVQVLREIARRRGGLPRAAMPVVFSSALGIDALDEGSPSLGQFGSQLGRVIRTISQTPQVWIDHQAVEEEGALLFNWDGVEELFPEGVLDDMFKAYCGLLNRLASSTPEWERSERDMLPSAQLKQRDEVNATAADVPDLLLHQLFFESCEKHARRTAIISARRTMTYSELRSCVSKIARCLLKRGVQPNTLIAVVMEKGWEQIAGVLGVLASGAAYVPIDPDLPEERRLQLFSDAKSVLVLTQTWVERRLAWPGAMTRLCVDDEATWADEESHPPHLVQRPGDLAYVIYTSGSTGMPKGVMINHRGAVNTVLDINQRYAIGVDDRVLALSALSFDLSVYDVFGMLAAGGAIVLPDSQGNKDAAKWARLITEHAVTVWNTVPALLQMFVEFVVGRKEKCGEMLRVVMLSGDWIAVGLPAKAKALWPAVRLISQGGATEASIWSISYPIESVDPEWSSIPYGKPLRNQTFHVLNQALEPCPVWVPGQLYIGGLGLAMGYWRDEEKTTARFIVHPETGARLYRTGDYGRFLPDGNIEFLGREDFQIKINGYRIELGEIEAALLSHPAIGEVVVATVDGARDTKQLVAYVVARSAKQVADADGLKAPVQGLTFLDKLKFKLEQRGLRELDPARGAVKLRKPDFDDALRHSYLRHRAYREFLAQPIAFNRFSDFMACLLQMRIDESPLPKYRYPSAGSLYPVQTYLYIKPDRVESLQGGVYYYHPAEHQLMQLSDSDDVHVRLTDAHVGPNMAIFEQAAFALFSIGELSAIEPLYGEWSKDFCYLEAGYIGQLLMDTAPDFELGLCPIGKLDVKALRAAFDWQDSQIFVQGFLGGRVDAGQIEKMKLSAPRAALSREDLREFLRQKLPEHMVPSSYVFLDALPLSGNGKLDRKALPGIDVPRHGSPEALKFPSSDLEKCVAEIAMQALGVDRIGLNSNLFDLGADSVMIVRLNNLLVEAFGREIPVVEMFQNPTVGYLASYLKDEKKSPLVSVQSRAEKIRNARKRRIRA